MVDEADVEPVPGGALEEESGSSSEDDSDNEWFEGDE